MYTFEIDGNVSSIRLGVWHQPVMSEMWIAWLNRAEEIRESETNPDHRSIISQSPSSRQASAELRNFLEAAGTRSNQVEDIVKGMFFRQIWSEMVSQAHWALQDAPALLTPIAEILELRKQKFLLREHPDTSMRIDDKGERNSPETHKINLREEELWLEVDRAADELFSGLPEEKRGAKKATAVWVYSEDEIVDIELDRAQTVLRNFVDNLGFVRFGYPDKSISSLLDKGGPWLKEIIAEAQTPAVKLG